QGTTVVMARTARTGAPQTEAEKSKCSSRPRAERPDHRPRTLGLDALPAIGGPLRRLPRGAGPGSRGTFAPGGGRASGGFRGFRGFTKAPYYNFRLYFYFTTS